MSSRALLSSLEPDVASHLENVGDNLQLLADLAYGDVALAVARPDGALVVVNDARPNTAVAPIPATRVGQTLGRSDHPEAYEAFSAGVLVEGARSRTARGIKYTTAAFPIGVPETYAVLVRDLADSVAETSGAMETAFMSAARELIAVLAEGPLLDVHSGEPFATTRTAGDGVMGIDREGRVTYASPNAVNIMRGAGHEGPVLDMNASELPGGGFGVAPVLGVHGALAVDTEVGGRALAYRSIAVGSGVLVLVQDVTEARRREAELKVKEATIREVHHRVKNNLQTIASLLRIQARRSGSDEARRELEEATERVSSMAVVHDLLAGSEEERVDFAEAARTVVGLVKRGLVGDSSAVDVHVEGDSGDVDAHAATSLALATAELVHNALEHGHLNRAGGEVVVQLRRLPGELVLVVRDNGSGLPEGFDATTSANLGLAIVRTVVEDDLRGTLSFTGGRGTTVTVRVPLLDNDRRTPEE